MRASVLYCMVLLGTSTSIPYLVRADDPDKLKLHDPSRTTIDTSASIHDIYGPIILPEPFNWLPYLVVLLLFLVAGSILFYYFKRPKNQPELITPAHVTALAELSHARKYIETEQSLQYTQRLSAIIRSYVEKQFHARMTRQTTSEFFAAIVRDKNSPLYTFRASLKRCLEQCDLAKYARKTSDKKSMEELEKSVRLFIEDTAEAKVE